MTTFLDLFNIIENTSEFPDRIETDPDKAIHFAKLAISGKYDLSESLNLLEEEIKKFRQIVRGLIFDVIKRFDNETQVPPGKLNRLGTELHQLAAMISMRLNKIGEARNHLMQALACDPHNQDTEFYFVEIYEESGAYLEAFEQLEKTFGNTEAIDKFLRLFELCWGIQKKASDLSCELYEKIGCNPNAGLFAILANTEIFIIKNNVPALSPEMVSSLLNEGIKMGKEGRHNEAINTFFNVLGFYPFHPGAWYFMGDVFLSFLVPLPENRQYGHLLLDEKIIGDENAQLVIKNAIQAFEIATILKPDNLYARELLISSLLLANKYKDALRCAENGYGFDSTNPDLIGFYALTLSLNGHFDEAEKFAMQALLNDSSNLNALTTIKRIENLK